MNIFYLDSDPVVAAEMMCDKHVVKMILESAQMLSTAHRVIDGDEIADSKGMYKMAHRNHPSTIWARSSAQNYTWLWGHMAALMREYTHRYGKIHATEQLKECLARTPTNILYGGKLTAPPQCMPDEYKCNPNSASHADCISAYREYYLGDKMYMATWKFTEAPSWINV